MDSTSARFGGAAPILVAILILSLRLPPASAAAQPAGKAKAVVQARSPVERRYRNGDSLHYHLEAVHEGRRDTLRYSADVDGRVKRDSLGRFYEDLRWSRLERNGVAIPLAAAAAGQRLTLSPDYMLPPDIAHTDPRLIGPVLDLLTFYVDLWLAVRQPGLVAKGDHVRVPGHGSNSWADGRYVTLGEDAVDFDLTLVDLDEREGAATLLVRHVPPKTARVRFPAEWMRAPVADSPNNWVQVGNAGNGRWRAGVGQETFDVRLVVSLADGRVRSATMDNPVIVSERTCTDSTLSHCDEAVRYRIHRLISLR